MKNYTSRIYLGAGVILLSLLFFINISFTSALGVNISIPSSSGNITYNNTNITNNYINQTVNASCPNNTYAIWNITNNVAQCIAIGGSSSSGWQPNNISEFNNYSTTGNLTIGSSADTNTIINSNGLTVNPIGRQFPYPMTNDSIFKGRVLIDDRDPTDPTYYNLRAYGSLFNVVGNTMDSNYGYAITTDNRMNGIWIMDNGTVYPNTQWKMDSPNYGSQFGIGVADYLYDGTALQYWGYPLFFTKPVFSPSTDGSVDIGWSGSQFSPTTSPIYFHGISNMVGQMGGLGSYGMILNPLTLFNTDGDFSPVPGGIGTQMNIGWSAMRDLLEANTYSSRLEFDTTDTNNVKTPLMVLSGQDNQVQNLGNTVILNNQNLGSQMVSNGDFSSGITNWSGTGWEEGYEFTISYLVTPPAIGDTYTNNGNTYTIELNHLTAYPDGSGGYTYAGTLICSGSGSPDASGSLVRTSGTGEDPINYDSSKSGAYHYQNPTTNLIQANTDMLNQPIAGHWYKFSIGITMGKGATYGNQDNMYVSPTVAGTLLIGRGVNDKTGDLVYSQIFKATDNSGILLALNGYGGERFMVYGISLVEVPYGSLEVGDINSSGTITGLTATGSNAGSPACIDANGALCLCGSCA